MKHLKLIPVLVFLVLLLHSCKSDQKKTDRTDLIIRLAGDPEKLNPVFNPAPAAREIFQYIFLPLADFHPESLDLTPILIEKLPEVLEDRPGLLGYKMRFRNDAKWSDGKDLTGEDYAFTIKAIKHPGTTAVVWRSLVNEIKDVVIDPDDKKSFIVYVNSEHMLSLEIATTIYILPKHVYDENSALDKLSFESILDTEEAQKLVEQNEGFSNFAEAFNDPINFRDKLVSCGPYQLTEKESNQYYILEKNQEYWGDKYPQIPFLNGHIKTLKFSIIPDEMTAVTAFKDGKIDLMKIRNSSVFHELKEQNQDNDKFQFFTPQLMRQQYFSLNNANIKLKDVNVRKALAYLIDVEDIIKTIDYGYGVQSVGPFHPTKPYYNKSLKPIKQDIEMAKRLLADSGWKDLDNDGDLEKVLEGNLTELELDLLISGSELSKKVALLFQEAAKKAGVIINVVAKPFRRIRSENLRTKDFEIVASLSSSDANPDDPYNYWHSESTDEGEQNIFSYKSEKSDALIEKIRTTRNPQERTKYYLEFQKTLYEDQPVVFLYAPTDKILVSNLFEASACSKRPGYLANTFKTK